MEMAMSEIIAEIDAHIKSRGGGYSAWYVGITEAPDRRVFEEQGVGKDKDKYIWRTASSSSIARDVEQHFLELGCDGGPGGGDTDAKVVYAYKKSNRTTP